MTTKQHKEAAEKCIEESAMEPLDEAALLTQQSIAYSLLVLGARLEDIEAVLRKEI